MSDLKVQGRLCEVFSEEAKTDSFRSRNFVIETEGQYPQFVQFQLVQDRCGLIDAHLIGDLITVHFDLRGKKWNEKYITNLNAWKIEGDGTPQQTRMPYPDAVGNTAQAYDLPANPNVRANHDLPKGDPLAAVATTPGRVEPADPFGDEKLPF